MFKGHLILALSTASLASLAALTACGEDDGDSASAGTGGTSSASGGQGGGDGASESPGYVLGSVVISDNDMRTTYVQVVKELTGHITNDNAIEAPGNGVLLARGNSFYLGLAEEPTWVKYTVDADGNIEQAESLSFLNQGMTYIDYGNVIVDDETAVTVSTEAFKAIVWNPKTMTIKGTIDLGHLQQDGYALETWTTTAKDGLVYVPGRWANWNTFSVRPAVSLTVLDPETLKEVGTAEDDRCASGGRVVWSDDGYGYVMGDGRNYTIQMAANAARTEPPQNCLLRIAEGAIDFDEDFFVTIPSLTGGLESATELETAQQGSGIAFAKMFYPDQLPEGMEAVDFSFWGEKVFKMWRIELGDEPKAVEVEGMPFATMGFSSVELDGKLITGESPDGAISEIYEVDPKTNVGVKTFTMDGSFYGVFRLGE